MPLQIYHGARPDIAPPVPAHPDELESGADALFVTQDAEAEEDHEE